MAVDVHSGAVNDPRWRWSFPLLAKLFEDSCLIVTNLALLESERIADATKIIVLHDILPRGSQPTPLANSRSSVPTIVFPASYADDEPITEILEAARMRPDWCWVLTGNAPEEVRQLAPSNLRFTGYIEQSAYLEVIRSADVVLALTRREATMQRGGYEALANCRPIVASSTQVLKSFFADSALYTDNSSSSIASVVDQALTSLPSLSSAGRRILEKNIENQERATRSLKSWLMCNATVIDGRA
ncbi:glycosyltransferase [Gordonia sp. CNJ-863]|uniref:glycosyltransferase n=1 Tax=Gordonia sp. CNJ-863 TaxID=1904963 RepID=UPI0013010EE2|nr:glycosyltransferase [Gordonia sp. CNJ-863]